jgi:hypothetical protein
MYRERYGRDNDYAHGGKEKSNPEPVGHESLDAKTKLRQITIGVNVEKWKLPPERDSDDYLSRNPLASSLSVPKKVAPTVGRRRGRVVGVARG